MTLGNQAVQHMNEITALEDPTDQQQGRSCVMPLRSEINMTNCYKLCEHFFERCKSIHFNALIAYWIMAGYLGPVDSVEEAYEKGLGILLDLICQKGILKRSTVDRKKIEFVRATDPKLCHCGHQGLCASALECLEYVDLLDLNDIENIVLTEGMLNMRSGSVYGNYLTRQVSSSRCGLKYLAHYNPTPNSLKPLLENVFKPSVLLLRDYELLPQSDFPFEKFKTLTVLEISGPNHLTTIPENTISEMIQLQSLNLSHLLIETLPSMFFYKLTELRWLILRGCPKLKAIPFFLNLQKLEGLDLSHCTALQHLQCWTLMFPQLQMLDLSCTALCHIPTLMTSNLTHVFLKDSKLVPVLNYLEQLTSLQVLNLSGSQNVKEVNPLNHNKSFEVLDLSRTDIKCIDFLPDLIHLRGLILCDCTHFEKLPTMEKLTNLEVLDLSGCEKLVDLPESFSCLLNLMELNLSGCSCLEKLSEGIFDEMTCLTKLDLSNTRVKHLPSFEKCTSLCKLSLRGLELDTLEALTFLSTLVELDLSGVKISSSEEFNLDFLQSFDKLQILNLTKTSVAKLPDTSKLASLEKLLLTDCPYLQVQALSNIETLDPCLTDNSIVQEGHLQGQSGILNPVEIHIVSSISNQLSGFLRFIHEFPRLDALISNIQNNFDSGMATSTVVITQPFKRQVGMLHADLKYIRDNIDRLQSSPSCRSTEELLNELVQELLDSTAPPTNIKQLLRRAVKVKLLVPRKQTADEEASGSLKKKKQSSFTKTMSRKNINGDIDEQLSSLVVNPLAMDDLLSAYRSLTEMERHSLLCFSAFPCNKDEDETTRVFKSLVIKNRVLIHWWAGEGFINPDSNPDTTTAASIGSTDEGVNEPKTIEDIGEQILMTLRQKGFIELVKKKRRERGSSCMHYTVHSFLTAQAKEEGLFDINKANDMLTPYLTRSKRDYLLKSTSNTKNVDDMSSIHTLFNVNESAILIEPELFSKMKCLSVLHLGSWSSEDVDHIEVGDASFLDTLKNMKQLRLLSLQGLTTITSLPEIVSKLTNLIILSLRECTYLARLPDNIGTLTNLTHLDMTNCRLLTKLPKGIRLLSKLEVLKGFIISSQDGGSQSRNVCNFRDLSELANLRALTVIVNISKFPDDEELQVLKGMRKLRKLKISWEKDLSVGDKSSSHENEALEPLKWKKLKCWKYQTRLQAKENTTTIKHLDNLEKLELCCYPFETAPRWLVATELKELQKLYIVGGNLKRLNDSYEWKVRTLCFKYLTNMEVQWIQLMEMFPNVTYLERWECPNFGYFPGDQEGVWERLSGDELFPGARPQILCSGCRKTLIYYFGSNLVKCHLCGAGTFVPPAAVEMAQMQCKGCRSRLMYTNAATSVLCPRCLTVNLPAIQDYISCGSCSQMMMYQNGAPAVTCPQCNFVTQIGDSSTSNTDQELNHNLAADQPRLTCKNCKMVITYPHGVLTVACPICKFITQVGDSSTNITDQELYLYRGDQVPVTCEKCRAQLMCPSEAPAVVCPLCNFLTSLGDSSTGITTQQWNQADLTHMTCGNCGLAVTFISGARAVSCPVCKFVTRVEASSTSTENQNSTWWANSLRRVTRSLLKRLGLSIFRSTADV